MANVVNQVLTDPFGPLRNAAGTALTGLTFSNKTAFLGATPATTATLTFTEIGNGFYKATFTPTAVGTWLAAATYPSDGQTRDIAGTYEVETAAQADPASVDPFATAADGYTDPASLGYKVRAIFARGVTSGHG